MEFNFREVRLRHLQHIIGIGKKHVAPVTVQRHKLMLALFKRCQSSMPCRDVSAPTGIARRIRGANDTV